MDLSSIPVIDHHAHALLRERGPFDLPGFQRFFTESDDPRIHSNDAGQTLFFRWATKELAAYFGCEPTAAAVLVARNALQPDALARRLFRDANLAALLVDYGFEATVNLTPAEMQAKLPCRIERILRLETMAQDLILENESYDRFLEAFTDRVENARASGHVGLKSIIAYRTGLAIREWSREEGLTAFRRSRERANREGAVRLA
ncbi:MAG: hypothetical protein P8020_20990, partial [Acidobacteriota bacterium]